MIHVLLLLKIGSFIHRSQQSGDNFLGVLSSREMYLATNQQQTIQVTNMRVPERPEGTKVVHTLRVSKGWIILVHFK